MDSTNTPLINPQNEHKFNLGLSTLEELHEILKEIRKITINIKDPNTMQLIMPQGKAQHMKYRLTKQLLVRASPLLGKENTKELNGEINEIEIGWKRPNVGSSSFKVKSNSSIPEGCVEIYYPKIDRDLDDFIIKIQEKLQAKGKSFMPTKGEAGLF